MTTLEQNENETVALVATLAYARAMNDMCRSFPEDRYSLPCVLALADVAVSTLVGGAAKKDASKLQEIVSALTTAISKSLALARVPCRVVLSITPTEATR